nr:hypothetical protein GCM10020092_038820 [Actinoplanes digitatis]
MPGMTVTAETGSRAAPAGRETDPAGVRWLIFARDRGIFVLWAVLLIGFSVWASPYFASLDNALLIANAAALTAIFAARHRGGHHLRRARPVHTGHRRDGRLRLRRPDDTRRAGGRRCPGSTWPSAWSSVR